MLALRKSLPSLIRSQKFSFSSNKLKHTLPDLPYAYDALEPVICREIMELHHQKHHAAYVNNLNIAEEKLKAAIENCDVSAMIAVQSAIRFNGGGHLNHSIFWNNLTPSSCAGPPNPDLTCAIDEAFGCMDKMKELLSNMAVGLQGSGWAWLGMEPLTKKLRLAACANQDPLQAMTGLIPLLGIDVWEHAYYVQYKNARADYVNAIWEVINWQDVSDRFCKAKAENPR